MVDRVPLVEFLKIEEASVRRLEQVLMRTLAETRRDLRRRRGAGAITDPVTRVQLEATRAAIKQYLGISFFDFENIIGNGKGAAAAAASRVISRQEDALLSKILSRSRREGIAAAEAARAAATVETTLQRMLNSHKPLSARVYSTRSLVFGQVDSMINRQLARGGNWRQLSNAVLPYIDPRTAGGAAYAARRLARTEINNAFHFATVERYQRSDIVEKVAWNLSRSHGAKDICDRLAEEGPYPIDGVPEKGHPQCFCYITPELPSPEEFLDGLMKRPALPQTNDLRSELGEAFKSVLTQTLAIAAERKISQSGISQRQIESTRRELARSQSAIFVGDYTATPLQREAVREIASGRAMLAIESGR